MSNRCLHLVFLASIVVFSATAAQSAVVTVSPENMNGWSIVVNPGGSDYDVTFYGEGGSGELTNCGAAVWEKEEPFVYYSDEAEKTGRFELGRGAFYATCNYAGISYGGATPSNVWIGTDTFNGQPLAGVTLNRITEMKYYAYVAKIVCRQQPSHPSWDFMQYWTYPRHPITLQLTIEDPTGTTRRQLWYTPWHKTKVRGENSGQNAKKWILYDCMAPDDPNEPFITNRWYCCVDGGSQDQIFPTWADVLQTYGDWKLVPTSTTFNPDQGQFKSSGWDNSTTPVGTPQCTATGKCLNFEVGARKWSTPIFGEGASISWGVDYIGFRGYMDHFTLGIDGTSVTYDFEPAANAPDPKILARANRSQFDKILGKPFVQNSLMTMVYGKLPDVENNLSLHASWFTIDDGSGLTIPIRVQKMSFLVDGVMNRQIEENHALVDEYWSAWGLLEKPRLSAHYTNPALPYVLWTTRSHCKGYYSPWQEF